MTTDILKYRVADAPKPGTPEWRKIWSASKVAPVVKNRETGEYAGFGYDTPAELYDLMVHGHTKDYSEDVLAMFQDGHDAEASNALRWLSRERANGVTDWELSEGEVSFTNTDLPFPNVATIDRVAISKDGNRVHGIEIKRPRNAGVKPGWIIQVRTQLEFSGLNAITLVVDPVFGPVEFHTIERDQEQQTAIVEDIMEFQKLIESGTRPEEPISPRNLGNYTGHESKAIEASSDDVEELRKLIKAKSDAENAIEEIKTRLTESMMEAEARQVKYNGQAIISVTSGRFAKSRVKSKEHKELLASPELQKTVLDEKKLKKEYPDVYAEGIGNPSVSFRTEPLKSA